MRLRPVALACLSLLSVALPVACSASPTSVPSAPTDADSGAAAADGSRAEDAGAQARDGAPSPSYDAAVDAPAIDLDAGAGSDVTAPPGGALWASPTLPPFDDATIAHVRQVHALGRQKGRLDDVFMKVGDSITSSIYYLYDIGRGPSVLGDLEAPLRPVVNAFLGATLVDGSNPFSRDSNCAQGGMTTADALGQTPWIQMEVDDILPAYALMMYGTDDLEVMSASTYESNLGKIIDLIEGQGVVLAISTIPARPNLQNGDQIVQSFNDAVRRTAAARHLPLMDLHAGLDPLPLRGIGDDDVHLTVELTPDGGSMSADMSSAGRPYGYNFRNLMFLELMDRLRSLR